MNGFARFIGPKPVSFELIPDQGIDGDGPVYLAREQPCWFTIKPSVPLASGWVRISYEASLIETPERPLVRFTGVHGTTDHVLPAATFGRQSWIGFVPDGTTAIRISPRSRAGWLGFRIVQIEKLSLPYMLMHAASLNIGRAALAFLTTVLFMRTAQRINLRVAVTGTPLARYDSWRRANGRRLELDGIDALPIEARPHIRVVSVTSTMANADSPLLRSLQRQSYRNFSVRPAPPCLNEADLDIQKALAADPNLLAGLMPNDFIVAVPSGWSIEATTLLALAHAAAAEPNCPGFFGDDDARFEDGSYHAPRLRTAYDPTPRRGRLLQIGPTVLALRTRDGEG